MEKLLEVKDLKVAYGGIEAVRGISFDVPEGQIVCLYGSWRNTGSKRCRVCH